MPIALSSLRNELLPGLFDVRGSYDMIPRQWDKVYKTRKSNMSVESSTQMAFLGLPFLKTEGGATQFDNEAGERWKWNIEAFEVALGYSMTRKVIDDSLYKAQFNPTNLKMQEVFAQFKEIQAASVINTATVAIPGLGGDGVPFASTAHPVDGATYANRFSVDISLSEASLLQGQVNIRQTFVNERNVKILARARQLIVPVALEPIAIRLLKTELRPGSADNDVNAILSTAGGLPEGYIALDFLTSNFAWFLKTNIEGLIHILRIPFEMDMWVDNVTDNLLVKGYERYTFAYNDPRCMYFSFPTS